MYLIEGTVVYENAPMDRGSLLFPLHCHFLAVDHHCGAAIYWLRQPNHQPFALILIFHDNFWKASPIVALHVAP